MNGNLHFRVYDKTKLDEQGNWTFCDYKIHHYDLEIKIVDKHVSFYHTKDDKFFIDYSPNALGMKEIKD